VNIQDKLGNWMSRIRKQITLRRKWYIYALALLVFIIGSYYYRDAYLFQISVTLFSIAIVYLVMETSNIELRETTEKQIKAFVENLQMVCSGLKSVSDRIDTLANVMRDVQKTILESTLVSQTAISKAEEEKRRRKESIKPQIYIKSEIRGIQVWILFDNRHYVLNLWNFGSDAIGTTVSIGNFTSRAYDIRTREQTDIDIGHVNNFVGRASLDVLIEVRDVDRNPYRGRVQVSLPQPQLNPIMLTEA
jgi:Ca2+/Na+ antiporter